MFARTVTSCISRSLHTTLRNAVFSNFQDSTTPVITIPITHNRKYVKKRLSKKQKKGKVLVLAKPGKLLLSCSERMFNMYTNEFPTKFEPPALASQSWTGPKSPGKHFTIMATRENPSVMSDEDIEELGLDSRINEALSEMKYTCPTKVQTQAIPVIMNGYNVLFVAETGSGKTYSYLLPIIHNLLTSEEKAHRPQFPTCVILVPTKELSSQVQKMGEKLNLPIRICSLDSLKNMKYLKEEKIDIIVSTPVRLVNTLKKRQLALNDVKEVVVDECDTLLDASFSDVTLSILNRLNIYEGKSQPMNASHKTQLILCSATFPSHAENALTDILSFDNIATVQTGYTHRILPHVQHKFLRVKPSEKYSSLLHILNSQLKAGPIPTMVFCNNIDTCIWLTEALGEEGLKIASIHKGLNMNQRKSSMKKLNNDDVDILVTTDLSSRGVNTTKVEHVINYDFPNAVSDYVHRSGRCGRVDQKVKGCVTSLISKKWEVPTVNQIEGAARKRDQIEGIDANIKQFLILRNEHKKLMKKSK